MLTKAEISIIEYQIEREKVGNAKGLFRCEEQLKGDLPCLKQCESCNLYYVNKLK